jgi:hypothetical protein
MLKYSPIGEKFPLTTAPRTLYTVQRKKLENVQNFFVLEVFMYPNNFDVQICLLMLYETYIEFIFCFFYFRNLVRDNCLRRKKVENMTLKFYSNRAFSRFFRFSSHLLSYINKYKRYLNNFKGNEPLRHRTLTVYETFFWTLHCNTFSKYKNTILLITF